MLAAATAPARAQDWNDVRALNLVRRATDRRVQQFADSGLVDYQATAHGYVTFLAQLGEGFLELPRVVKADELALQVYWRAPNLSKQRVIGRRDTTLMPTDIRYHRDHLGIVQNNFPAIIRIGEGDEVRDVPHPLSPAGLRQYEFALTDSLRISMPGRAIDVYELKVRPLDDEQPRVLGALYIDRESAAVVRMALSFTRSSYLDKQLEDVFVVLENGLMGNRFWLPRRQEIEIRRKVAWLDYPVRGIIRGRWEIGDYALNVDVPSTRFVGPEITFAAPAELRSYEWPASRLLDLLPGESRLATPTEILRVQSEARAVVQAQLIGKPRGLLAARGASDLIRFDRNAGLSLGAGVNVRVGRGLVFSVRGRRGFADEELRGTVEFGWRDPRGVELSVFAMDDTRDAGDVLERSSLVNSLAAQEFASDFSDLYGVRGWGVTGIVTWAATRWTASMAFERPHALDVHASAFDGALAPAFDADPRDGQTMSFRVERPTSLGWFGVEWRGTAEGRVWTRMGTTCDYLGATTCYPSVRVQRGVIALEAEREFGAAKLASRTIAGAVAGDHFVRAQDLLFLGGPVSAPGYAFHELVGESALSQRVEVRVPAPFPTIRLGRFGRMPARATLAPYWNVVGLNQPEPFIARGSRFTPVTDPLTARESGWYNSVGVGLVLPSDLVRLDVARTLSTGRWLFSIDFTRAYWGIL